VHPTVPVTIDGARATLTLDVVAKLKLEGMKLVIELARITRILSGTVTSTLSITFRDVEVTVTALYRGKVDLLGQFVIPGRDQPEWGERSEVAGGGRGGEGSSVVRQRAIGRTRS
jgi:hypothetical protein